MPCKWGPHSGKFLLGLTLLFNFAFTRNLLAQSEVKSLPVQFGQFMNMGQLVNPGLAGTFNRMDINMGNQRQGGNWGGVSTYYALANYRLNRFSDSLPGNKHIVGAKLLSDYEGTYISRTRIYGTYSFHTPLNSGIWVSAGTHLGLMNYAVQGSALSGDGSDTNVDGDIGFSVYNNSYQFGLSINQIFNSKLQPYQEVTRLTRHFGFTAACSLDVGPLITFRPNLLLRYANSYTLNTDAAAIFVFDELISAGINYRSNRAWVFMAGLEEFGIGENGKFKLVLSYSIPLPQANLFNIRQYELTLAWMLR